MCRSGVNAFRNCLNIPDSHPTDPKLFSWEVIIPSLFSVLRELRVCQRPFALATQRVSLILGKKYGLKITHS